MAIKGCAECLKKQREIDRLTEELQRLRQKLCHRERQATEGFFGSATPSAQGPSARRRASRAPRDGVPLPDRSHLGLEGYGRQQRAQPRGGIPGQPEADRIAVNAQSD